MYRRKAGCTSTNEKMEKGIGDIASRALLPIYGDCGAFSVITRDEGPEDISN